MIMNTETIREGGALPDIFSRALGPEIALREMQCEIDSQDTRIELPLHPACSVNNKLIELTHRGCVDALVIYIYIYIHYTLYTCMRVCACAFNGYRDRRF